MMRIFSADKMANISPASIKKIMKSLNSSITDSGAAELARILEDKAREISIHAVENAKKANRSKVTKEDIKDYIMKNGDGTS